MARKRKEASTPPAQHQAAGEDVQPLATMLADDYSGPTALAAIDLSTVDGKRLFVNLGSVPTLTPDRLKGKVFRLASWAAERRLFADQKTGEERWAVAVSLIDPDGLVVRFGSDAVCRALDRVRQAFGNGPYDPPLYVRIERVQTSSGRQTYSVVLVDESQYEPLEVALPPKRGRKPKE